MQLSVAIQDQGSRLKGLQSYFFLAAFILSQNSNKLCLIVHLAAAWTVINGEKIWDNCKLRTHEEAKHRQVKKVKKVHSVLIWKSSNFSDFSLLSTPTGMSDEIPHVRQIHVINSS